MMKLGGLDFYQGLEYMKNNPDVVMIECNEPEWKYDIDLDASLYIPYSLMSDRLNQIPVNSKVLLCSNSIFLTKLAYCFLLKQNIKIKELSYIKDKLKIEDFNYYQKIRNG